MGNPIGQWGKAIGQSDCPIDWPIGAPYWPIDCPIDCLMGHCDCPIELPNRLPNHALRLPNRLDSHRGLGGAPPAPGPRPPPGRGVGGLDAHICDNSKPPCSRFPEPPSPRNPPPVSWAPKPLILSRVPTLGAGGRSGRPKSTVPDRRGRGATSSCHLEVSPAVPLFFRAQCCGSPCRAFAGAWASTCQDNGLLYGTHLTTGPDT